MAGLLAIDLMAGETLLVSGATGNFGSAGVAVALAMGAGCVVAPGRNEAMLQSLERRFGARVRAVKLTGDAAEDTRRMKAAAPSPIDCVLDLLPPLGSILGRPGRRDGGARIRPRRLDGWRRYAGRR